MPAIFTPDVKIAAELADGHLHEAGVEVFKLRCHRQHAPVSIGLYWPRGRSCHRPQHMAFPLRKAPWLAAVYAYRDASEAESCLRSSKSRRP